MTDTDQEPVDTSSDDEIAVDLPYAELVLSHLNGFAGGGRDGARIRDTEPRLNLALITLDMPLIIDKAKEVSQFQVRPGTYATDIDYVLDGLRHDIGKKYSDWHPPIGKNRHSKTIGGLPHIDTGKPVATWEYPTISGEGVTIPPVPYGAQEVRVGVVDGQLFPNRQLDNRWYTLDSTSVLHPSTTGYSWLQGHSAFVAGKILEKAPAARLEFCGTLKGEMPAANVWDVAKAMAQFADGAVKILNLSIGCFTLNGQAPFVLERAVEVLTGKGVVLVAAAGNHGNGKVKGIKRNAPIYPAASPNVVAVGAVQPNDSAGYHRAEFSPEAPWIDLVAPGFEVTSTYLSGKVEFTEVPGLSALPVPAAQEFEGYARWSGTSFATATVSGEIARMVSTEGKTPLQALEELRHQNPDDHAGIGRYQKL